MQISPCTAINETRKGLGRLIEQKNKAAAYFTATFDRPVFAMLFNSK